MTIRISEETIVLVAIVIGIFLLALICLACSLNPRELVDGSLFRCCGCRRRGCCSRFCGRHSSSAGNNGDQEPQTYATLNEFIFESDDADEERGGFVAMNSMAMPTTMEQVFPDLLGSEQEMSSPHPSTMQSPTRSDVNTSVNAELSEPLL